MFDSLTNSADGLFVLIYIITVVIFFLFGPHKIYESIFWALLGLWLYLLLHEMTFVYTEITRTMFIGNWLVDNRGTLLWLAKWSSLLLFFITPATLWLNVSGVVRGTFWFFLKTIILSVIFVLFGTALFSILSAGIWVFGEVAIIPNPLGSYLYFQNSQFFSWMSDKTIVILLAASMLSFYKIIFSHWISRMLLLGSLIYAKSHDMFKRKNYDSVAPIDVMSHDDMHWDENHH